MSTATADAGVPPPAKGKKKLILIIAVALVVLLAGGGAGALMLMKKKADAADDADDHASAKSHASAPRDPAHPPTYVPLDPFTVNLADKQADRYAQVAVTLELNDPAVAASIKAFMPAVRNNILLAVAHRSAAELMEADGKKKLAAQIQKETARALGLQVDDDDAEEPEEGRGKRKSKRRPAPLPVSAVYFSTFIIQ